MLIIRAITHCDLDQVEREAQRTYGSGDGDVVLVTGAARLWFFWTGSKLRKATSPVVPSVSVGA